MRKEGLEFTVKKEIQTTNKKMRELESEIIKQEEITKQELLRLKGELRMERERNQSLG